jgi:adenylate cyclase
LITSRQRRITFSACTGVLALLAGHLLFAGFPEVFVVWNHRLTDRLYARRAMVQKLGPAYAPEVVHVDLDDTTIREMGTPYAQRSDFARAVTNLMAMGVAVQAWDMFLPGRTAPAEDAALIEASRRADNVLFGLAFHRFGRTPGKPEPPDAQTAAFMRQASWPAPSAAARRGLLEGDRPAITFPELASAAAGLGFLNIQADVDGVHRRLPLLVRCADGLYPSLSLLAVCRYLGVPPERVEVDSGRAVILRGARRRPADRPLDLVIPVDAQGCLLINFGVPWGVTNHYHFGEIMKATDDRDWLDLLKQDLQGRIVIVSEVRTGSADVGAVPGDAEYPLGGLHANAIRTILSGCFLREMGPWPMLGVEGLLAAGLVLLGFARSSWRFTLGTLALVTGYLGLAVIAFLYASLVLNLLRPALIIGGGFVAIMAHRYLDEERQKVELRRSFEAYFPPTVVRRILSHPAMITTGGQKKELTILFSDIQGFTHYSATVPPDEIQRLLNEYFDRMVEIVFRHGGTVDKFMGDGLMVFFGDPEPQEDHALRAVRAAIDMQRSVHELQARWETQGRLPIRIRIGINTGPVVVGNMGSARRLSYTVIGAAVNLAQRLEANAPAGGILIAERTREQLSPQFATKPLGSIVVKGLDEPVTVHEVLWRERQAPL